MDKNQRRQYNRQHYLKNRERILEKKKVKELKTHQDNVISFSMPRAHNSTRKTNSPSASTLNL